MSNYDAKYGEWLRYVQQQVESVGKPEEGEAEEMSTAEARSEDVIAEGPSPESEEFGIPRTAFRDRMGRALPPDMEEIDTGAVVADSSLIDGAGPVFERRPGVFDDVELPDVEDFLPFLREPGSDTGRPREREAPRSQRSLFVPEGTGEPKPAPSAERGVRSAESPARREPRPPRIPHSAFRAPHSETPHSALRTGDEVAQHSYQQFKETREELVARLLDPPLSLEETARLLNVCPMTVRRYTNRGLLQHVRTAGNQRRFRLSDVLVFLESGAGFT